MKRKVFTGIIVILVLLLGSCDFLMPEKASEEVEYTDVEYSIDENGNTGVTLYLDGVGVPRTAAQRALTKDLATMSHDYFEVIFQHGGVLARASWELGQSAGIRGVNRAGGVAYNSLAGTSNTAAIFVGRKSDRTLLGVGFLTHVDRVQGQTLSSDNKSVTFTVMAVNTRVTAGGTVPQAASGQQPGQLTDGNASFFLDNARVVSGTIPAFAAPDASDTLPNAAWTSLDGVDYPIFKLAKFDAVTTPAANTTFGQYVFKGALRGTMLTATEVGVNSPAGTGEGTVTMVILSDAVKYYNVAGKAVPEIIKRDPRFLSSGNLWYVQDSRMDQATTVAFSTNPAQFANNGAFSPNVNITFTTKKQSDDGIFSFVFQIPVYLLSTDKADNGGPEYTQWYIRPGYGVPLYNLDNGVDAGGCVLMGVGVKGIDWLEIFTRGIGFGEPPFTGTP